MKFVLKTEKLFLVILKMNNLNINKFHKKGSSKKMKNLFYEICVENRKIIFSYLNINKFHKKGSSKKNEEPFL